VDGLLEGALEARAAGTTIVLCSDHGNLEDNSFKGHTDNPVPLLVVGPAAIDPVWDEVRSITDVAGAVLDWLDRKRTAS